MYLLIGIKPIDIYTFNYFKWSKNREKYRNYKYEIYNSNDIYII